MSELAVTHIGGEIDTAWNYRTEFLNYGTIYTHFSVRFVIFHYLAATLIQMKKLYVHHILNITVKHRI
jgi:hypothetical protein